jgi:hypothetical protein
VNHAARRPIPYLSPVHRVIATGTGIASGTHWHSQWHTVGRQQHTRAASSKCQAVTPIAAVQAADSQHRALNFRPLTRLAFFAQQLL